MESSETKVDSGKQRQRNRVVFSDSDGASGSEGDVESESEEETLAEQENGDKLKTRQKSRSKKHREIQNGRILSSKVLLHYSNYAPNCIIGSINRPICNMFAYVVSSSEADSSTDENDVRKWRLLAYTKQKQRSGNPPKRNSSSSEPDDAESASYCESSEGEEVVESVSETSDAGGAGFLDDEAMEASFSSELEEMEWEGSGESEGEDDGDGFIVDEAVDVDVHRSRKRRRAVVLSSTSSEDSGKGADDHFREKKKQNAHLGDEASHLVGDEREQGTSSEQLLAEEDSVAESSSSKASYSSENSDQSPENGLEHQYSDSGDSLSSKESESENSNPLPSATLTLASLKWKEDLVQKAKEAHEQRCRGSTSLRKLIYSDLPLDTQEDEDISEGKETEPELGGLFRRLQKNSFLTVNHKQDSSLVSYPNNVPSVSRDWTDIRNVSAVRSLFVTGSWGADDAQALLDEDDDVFGDFEDLETGEVQGSTAKEDPKPTRTDEDNKKKRLEKKKQLKTAFNVQYDNEGESSYLDDLKREVSEQEQRNREEFEGLDDQARILYEGVGPGCYVRMELTGRYISADVLDIVIIYICTCSLIFVLFV